MKESNTIKEYSDKLLGIANKIKLLASDFANSRIVEKGWKEGSFSRQSGQCK